MLISILSILTLAFCIADQARWIRFKWHDGSIQRLSPEEVRELSHGWSRDNVMYGGKYMVIDTPFHGLHFFAYGNETYGKYWHIPAMLRQHIFRLCSFSFLY